MPKLKQLEHTREECSEYGKKGGKKSGEARRRKATLKQELEWVLATNDTQKNITLALIKEALNGNVKAYETIRDTVGEKPKETIEEKSEIKVVMDSEINEWGK